MPAGLRDRFDPTSASPELDDGTIPTQIRMDGDTQEVSPNQVSEAAKTPYFVRPKDIEDQIRENPRDTYLCLMAGFFGTRAYPCSRFEYGPETVVLYTMTDAGEKMLGLFLLPRLIEIIAIDRTEVKKIDMDGIEVPEKPTEDHTRKGYL